MTRVPVACVLAIRCMAAARSSRPDETPHATRQGTRDGAPAGGVPLSLAEERVRSLAMLAEIQRTGDIFFPKRWMDATLWGHSSTSAALMVRTCLADLPPGYPDRLRRTILSSADDLFRAAR